MSTYPEVFDSAFDAVPPVNNILGEHIVLYKSSTKLLKSSNKCLTIIIYVLEISRLLLNQEIFHFTKTQKPVAQP